MIVTINMNSNIKMSRIVSVLMNICGYFFRELPKCKPMKQHAAQCCSVSSVTVSTVDVLVAKSEENVVDEGILS